MLGDGACLSIMRLEVFLCLRVFVVSFAPGLLRLWESYLSYITPFSPQKCTEQ